MLFDSSVLRLGFFVLFCLVVLGGPAWCGTQETRGPALSPNFDRATDTVAPRPVFPPSSNERRPAAKATETSSTSGLFARCACEGQWAAGDRVVSTVDNPSDAVGVLAGATGTIVCGQGGNPPLLVSWDGWTEGHDGNNHCSCPEFSAAPNTGWWVECSEIAPESSTVISGVCNGDYQTGSRVKAGVDHPQGAVGISVGDAGTVVCGDDEAPPLLVSWDGWTGGNDGNGYCADPGMNLPEGVTSAYWVECADVEAGSDVSCVCGGIFEKGDRVRALEDIYSYPNIKVHAGQIGTVVCGAGDPPLLVSWDNWQNGHDGNDNCDCPAGGLSDNSGWFVDCDVVTKEYPSIFADGFESASSTHWTAQ